MECNVCLEEKNVTKCCSCSYFMCNECIISNSVNNNLNCPYCKNERKIKVFVDHVEIPKEHCATLVEKYLHLLISMNISINMIDQHNAEVKIQMMNNIGTIMIPINHKSPNIYTLIFGKYPKTMLSILFIINILDICLGIDYYIIFYNNFQMLLGYIIANSLNIMNGKDTDILNLLINKLKNKLKTIFN